MNARPEAESKNSQSEFSRKPQISLRMAFLITLIAAVTAAIWGGLTRVGPDRLFFLFFAAAAPFGILILYGFAHAVFRWLSRR